MSIYRRPPWVRVTIWVLAIALVIPFAVELILQLVG